MSWRERIGVGGYSEVWRAHDAVLDRPVAIKLLTTRHSQDAETLVRFRNEAQLAGRLSHPNVARIYDFCDSQAADPAYLVMELVEGPSLAQVLQSGPIDAAKCMEILAQAAAGLAAAHEAGLVHRDIKPANLMLAPGGTLKITDFGLSHTLASAPITGTGLLIGTPAYLAPERAGGARATPAGDLYALGVVGYECLAGTTPVHRDTARGGYGAAGSHLSAAAGVRPAAGRRFIAQLTAKDPAARPPGAGVAARQAAELRDHPEGWQQGSDTRGLARTLAEGPPILLGSAPGGAPNHPTLVTAHAAPRPRGCRPPSPAADRAWPLAGHRGG